MENYISEGLTPLVQELTGLYSLYNGYLPPQLRPYTPLLLGTGALILGGTHRVLGKKKRKRESGPNDECSVKRAKTTDQPKASNDLSKIETKETLVKTPQVCQVEETKIQPTQTEDDKTDVELTKAPCEVDSVENLVLLAKVQEEPQPQQHVEVPHSVEPEVTTEVEFEKPKQMDTKLVVPKVDVDSESDDTASLSSREDSDSEDDIILPRNLRADPVESSDSSWSDDSDDSDTGIATGASKEDRLPELRLNNQENTSKDVAEVKEVHDLTQPDEEDHAPVQTDSSVERASEDDDTTSEDETVQSEADPQCEEEAWKFIMQFVGAGEQSGQANRASSEQTQASTSATIAPKKPTHMEKTAITNSIAILEAPTLPEALKNMFREVLLVDPDGALKLPIKCDCFLKCRRGKFNFVADKVQVKLMVTRLEEYEGCDEPFTFPDDMDTRERVRSVFDKAIGLTVAERSFFPLQVSRVLAFEQEGRNRCSALRVDLEVIHRTRLYD